MGAVIRFIFSDWTFFMMTHQFENISPKIFLFG